MTRPFAVIGFAALAALMACVFIGDTVALALSAVGMVCFLALSLWKKRAFFKQYAIFSVVLVTVSLSLFLYGFSARMNYEPYQTLEDTEATITGEIIGFPENQYGRFYYKVKIETVTIDGKLAEMKPFTIRLSASKAIDCEPYDKIQTAVKFFTHKEKFGFSSQSSYWAKGIPVSAYMSDYTAKVTANPDKPFTYYFQKLGKTLSKQLRFMLPDEEAAVTSAMLIGDRSGISSDIDFAFRKTGTTHLLVVSGMHMTLISAFMLGILSFLRIPRKAANLITILGIVGFVLLTGLQTSVIRSGIMSIVYLTAQLIDRESDSVNSLGFATLLICLTNPMAGGDIGFLLSVFATLGILKLTKPINNGMMKPFIKSKRIKKLVAVVVSPLAVGLAATIFVLPIQIFLFGGLSLVGPMATLLLSIPSTVMIYFAVFALLLWPIYLPLSMPFTLLTGVCAKLSVWIVNVMAEFDGYIGIMEGYGVLALCGILLLLAFLCLFKPTKTTKKTAFAMSLLIILTSVGVQRWQYRDSVTVAVSSSGTSPTVVVMQGEKAAVLAIEGYNTNAVREILMKNNIREISGLLLASDSRETLTAAEEILKHYSVRQIAVQNDVYIPRNLKENWERVPKLLYSDSVQVDWLEDIAWEITQSGIWLSYGNTEMILEVGEMPDSQAEIVITEKIDSKVNSPFTVLLSDDILVTENAKQGVYLSSAAQKTIYLDLFPHQKMQIRRAD
ncbi:ComEC/Rec2 family competence protein [Scatolibacter rhodanostii]|uniref:ComEC/Rec2 family competence protein n=1 Tax=Scatolibacter rhodanostii TaxID=2014781 RepID=UPI000C067EA4|nr:ComEC/Rec2 family competence protein [Scatolibacter rhodanostii]